MPISGEALSGISAALFSTRNVSHNIANQYTPGFKQRLSQPIELSPGGVGMRDMGLDISVGASNFTGREFDLSLKDSQSFFVLQNALSGERVFSRSGRFSISALGYIVQDSGLRLLGYGRVSSGNTSSALTALMVTTNASSPAATSNIQVQVNLDARDKVITNPFQANDTSSYNFKISGTIFDSLGSEHQVNTFFRKTANNHYDVIVNVDNTTITTGNVIFDTSGNITSQTNLTGLSFVPTTGAVTPQNFSLNLSNSTQLALPNSLNSFSQNGASPGNIIGTSIDSDGNISANYDNGTSQVVGQIAVAQFSAPQALQVNGGGSFRETVGSGAPLIQANNSRNAFTSGRLELSNVDEGQQVFELIRALRSIQANAKVLGTERNMLGTLIDIKT
ncbi:MAG: flagellar hook-basal body complex protein [Legionellales bacterium]|nr:flagellar hook-basal body complex protein [Legionellales bacterium]